ncbi:hypothetical protein HTIA_2482 [Halorhabdus tiamatea SARL4B]|uniref:Uncharacterized protein n=1 Tax=Halorhabdus tiamatea SARL4B TaxID=1033806 RepID=S6D3V8_9EURY|nr:hypothetical protein HTIA_2482 [Halorhabdus tiamatea SARL4B]
MDGLSGHYPSIRRAAIKSLGRTRIALSRPSPTGRRIRQNVNV